MSDNQNVNPPGSRTCGPLVFHCRHCGKRETAGARAYCDPCREVVLSEQERELRQRIMDALSEKLSMTPRQVAKELDMQFGVIAHVMWAMTDDRELIRVGDRAFGANDVVFIDGPD